MEIKVLGMVIGFMVLGGGLYYFAKDRHDPETRKIYGTFSAVGGIITVVFAFMAWL